MSEQRTSSGSSDATDSTTLTSTTTSSASNGSLPGPIHTPSSTPIIAGSLVGVIVLIVCVVTVLLLYKRRQRLRAERALRLAQYSATMNYPLDRLDKHNSLNGYGERAPPRTQDSGSSSASYQASPSGAPPPNNSDFRHVHQPPAEDVRPHSTHSSRHRHTNHRSNPDPQEHQPLPPPPDKPTHSPRQSTLSNQTLNRPSPLAESHSALTRPVPHTHPQPQAYLPQMTIPEPSSVPRGHTPDTGANVVSLDNNNASPGTAIFGKTNGSDAGERTASKQGSGGSRADVPAIVVTQGAGDSRGKGRQVIEGRGCDGTARGSAGESPPMAVNGVHSGNGNDEERSGTPDTYGVYSHALGCKQGDEKGHGDGRQRSGETSKCHASASGSEYSYRASGSGSGSTEGADSTRLGDSEIVGLTPDYGEHGRARTASGSTSGSMFQPPSSHLPTIPSSSSMNPSTTSAPNNGQRHSQQPKYGKRNGTNNANLPPSGQPFNGQGQNQAFGGHLQGQIVPSRLGTGAPTVEDEDAPPAYENIWAASRAEERLQVEGRRHAEREKSRTQ